MQMDCVVVASHVEDCECGSIVMKVWQYNRQGISGVTREGLEGELVQLFPDIARKGMKLETWYYDDIAGEVS